MAYVDSELALRSINKAISDNGGDHYPNEWIVQRVVDANSSLNQDGVIVAVTIAYRTIDLVSKGIHDNKSAAKYLVSEVKYNRTGKAGRSFLCDGVMSVLDFYEVSYGVVFKGSEDGLYEFSKEVQRQMSNERLLIFTLIASVAIVVADDLFGVLAKNVNFNWLSL